MLRVGGGVVRRARIEIVYRLTRRAIKRLMMVEMGKKSDARGCAECSEEASTWRAVGAVGDPSPRLAMSDFGVGSDRIEDALYPSMAPRHLCPSMGTLRRPLIADIATTPRCALRTLHSSARRLEEQPSDAAPAPRMLPIGQWHDEAEN